MLPGGSRTACMIWGVFPGLDLYCADLAPHIIAAGQIPDYSDRDLSGNVRTVGV